MGEIVLTRDKKGRPTSTMDSKLIWIFGGLVIAGIAFGLWRVLG